MTKFEYQLHREGNHTTLEIMQQERFRGSTVETRLPGIVFMGWTFKSRAVPEIRPDELTVYIRGEFEGTKSSTIELSAERHESLVVALQEFKTWYDIESENWKPPIETTLQYSDLCFVSKFQPESYSSCRPGYMGVYSNNGETMTEWQAIEPGTIILNMSSPAKQNNIEIAIVEKDGRIFVGGVMSVSNVKLDNHNIVYRLGKSRYMSAEKILTLPKNLGMPYLDITELPELVADIRQYCLDHPDCVIYNKDTNQFVFGNKTFDGPFEFLDSLDIAETKRLLLVVE